LKSPSDLSTCITVIVVGSLGLGLAPRHPPGVPAQSGQGPTSQVVPDDCVQFQSPARLAAGTPFRAALLRGLEFRLSSSWDISVRPIGQAALDYLWLVSPPLQTAPHRMIGPGYGLSAQDSARIERPLRFVLTRADYDAARAAIDGRLSGAETLRRLDQLGRGKLSLVITDYRIRDNGRLPDGRTTDVFEWVTFNGEACVPRQPQ
jgi:hypothetical protein